MNPDTDLHTNSIYPEVPPTDPLPEQQPPVQVYSEQFTSPAVSVKTDQLLTPKQDASLAALASAPSMAVVKTLSTRGLEYLFMSICLWIGATGLVASLLLLVNGQTSASTLAFPATSLVVCIPIFALFFIRLKKAELADPALRFDASKRRTSQITQVLAFLTSLFNIITFVYLLIAATAGNSVVSLGKAVINLLVILVIAGGILAYYWVDEHRSFNK